MDNYIKLVDVNEEKSIIFAIKNAYSNKSEHLLLHHEMKAKYKIIKIYFVLHSEQQISKTKVYTINADVERYEIFQFHLMSESAMTQNII